MGSQADISYDMIAQKKPVRSVSGTYSKQFLLLLKLTYTVDQNNQKKSRILSKIKNRGAITLFLLLWFSLSLIIVLKYFHIKW